MQTATVKYQIATYAGEIHVSGIDEDDDNDRIIAKVEQQLRREIGALPLGYQSFKVIDRQED
jgi:hypothetical protein